jgi:hypothetical protein
MAKISWVIGSEMLKENEGKRCSKNPAFDLFFMAPPFFDLEIECCFREFYIGFGRSQRQVWCKPISESEK